MRLALITSQMTGKNELGSIEFKHNQEIWRMLMEQYNLPLYQKSSLKWSMILLFTIFTLFFTAISIFSLIIMKDELLLGLLIGLFFLIFSIVCAYIVICVGILKRFYIEMTSEYIRVKLPLKSKTVYWNEIYDTQLYSYSNNTIISILLKKDVNKKKKRTISNNFNTMQGIPPYSFQISLMIFKDIDAKKLFLTIGEHINRADIKENADIDSLNERYEENDDNIVIAIITSILTYIVISAIDGIIIYKSEKNYLIIPIFGAFLIIAVFNKYYLKKTFNLIIRFYLGLICFLQVPTATIIFIIISEKIKFTITNILNVTDEYFNYILHNPFKSILVIIVAISCFVIGGFKGRTKKETVVSR